jgi:hypothetical protein
LEVLAGLFERARAAVGLVEAVVKSLSSSLER